MINKYVAMGLGAFIALAPFAAVAQEQVAQADTTTAVQQGMIENANVDAIQQMTRMISVSRAYEQVTSMMDGVGTASDQSIQRLGRVN